MRKSILMLAGFILILQLAALPALATSWVPLDPAEVSRKAEIVVLGQYDFTSDPDNGKDIFGGYRFRVEKVFRGSANSAIIAGIDHFDVGWADEFQADGGKFLLFLEKSKTDDFLVPVGGPNGMIQVREGLVSGDHKAFYEEILHSSGKEPVHKPEVKDERKGTNKVIASAAGFALVLFIGFQYRRKKRL